MDITSSVILDTLYSFIYPDDEQEEDEIEEENYNSTDHDEPYERQREVEEVIENRNPHESHSGVLIKGANHLFQSNTFAIPTFCNYCKEYIWGFTQQGYLCSVCGYTIHAKCLHKSPPTCRPKLSNLIKQNLDSLSRADKSENNIITNISSRSISTPSSPRSHHTPQKKSSSSSLNSSSDDHQHHHQFFFRHHFVEGNIPLGCDCDVCQESFELFGSDGWRCSRCEQMVHGQCKEFMERQECQPRHKKLLYVSNSVQKKFKGQFADHTPLIVFVNGRSGGQYGGVLIHEFTRLLDRHQVFDLNVDKGPERGLKKYMDVPNLRILVSGGDGTVGWVLTYIDKLKIEPFPPVAILPLGTGNDLARTLGWGTGYSGEELSPILDTVEQAKVVKLDRWKVGFSNGKEGIMNNYMSVGVDAEVALEFHNLRNNSPELFTSQFVNKFWYANYGLKCMFSDIDELAKMMELEVDGQRIELPLGVGGIMILNLPNYAGGADLWGDSEDDYLGQHKPQSIDDKLLEIVAITGSFHMGTIQVKLSQAIRIAQGHSIKIKLLQKLPVQVDGEPWLQDPSDIDVTFWNQAKMLYHTTETRVFRTLTDSTDEVYSNIEAENEKLRRENMILKSQLEALSVDLQNERIMRRELEDRLKLKDN